MPLSSVLTLARACACPSSDRRHHLATRAIGCSRSRMPPCWLRGVRLHVALDEVDPLDDDLVVVDEDLRDLALLALVLAADDDDEVAHA